MDVKRHLRGETEIVMDGTRFQIIYPRSDQNSPAQQKEALRTGSNVVSLPGGKDSAEEA